MSKGDQVTVKSEIGGKLETDYVIVAQNGGQIEVKWERDILTVSLLNRAGNATVKHTYARAAVRSVSEKRKDL